MAGDVMDCVLGRPARPDQGGGCEAGPVPVPEQVQAGLVGGACADGLGHAVLAPQAQGGEMVQGGTETGAPDDRVVGIHGAVAPGRSLGGEPVEQGAGTQHAAVAGSTDTGDHDDVAQTGDAVGTCRSEESL